MTCFIAVILFILDTTRADLNKKYVLAFLVGDTALLFCLASLGFVNCRANKSIQSQFQILSPQIDMGKAKKIKVSQRSADSVGLSKLITKFCRFE